MAFFYDRNISLLIFGLGFEYCTSLLTPSFYKPRLATHSHTPKIKRFSNIT